MPSDKEADGECSEEDSGATKSSNMESKDGDSDDDDVPLLALAQSKRADKETVQRMHIVASKHTVCNITSQH